jgi:hypothetical protein
MVIFFKTVPVCRQVHPALSMLDGYRPEIERKHQFIQSCGKLTPTSTSSYNQMVLSGAGSE